RPRLALPSFPTRRSSDLKTSVNPSQVALDPLKRYYISILPGDAADPLIVDNGVGHGMGGTQIAAGQTAVEVNIQPTPTPTAKISDRKSTRLNSSHGSISY